MPDTLILGLLLVCAGVGLVLIARFLSRSVKHDNPAKLASPPVLPLDMENTREAVLLVRKGGQVAFMNDLARAWFSTTEGKPNIERMARRARPSEAFIGLCATPGKASFFVDGQSLDAVSYTVPYEGNPAMLLAIRRVALQMETTQAGETSIGQVVETFTEIDRQIAADLDLERTLQSILENAEKLVPADYMEITYWDADDQNLVPYRLEGAPGDGNRLERGSQRYNAEDSYSGLMLTEQQPILISDRQEYHGNHPQVTEKSYPYQSFLGIPLTASGELVGTLELARYTQDGFTLQDQELLSLFSEQAGFAIHNALRYTEGQRRYQEIAGLTRMAQAVSSLKDPEDLFSQLVECIAQLIDVEVLGFLIYDENQRILEGKLPFRGFQPSMLDWARFPIPAGSQAEEVWLSQQLITTRDAPADPLFHQLGLDDLAVTAGIEQAVLAPLTTGGRTLGYLLAGDKRDGAAFDQSDLHLLEIITAQAAPIIENASLVQQSQRRAQRAETLRRIASLTGSTATLDEILRYSVQDLARLLQADQAALFLLDENRGELRLHKDSLLGINTEQTARLTRLPTDDPQYSQTITESRRPHLSDVADEDADLLPVYRNLVATLNVRSLIIAPLIIRERGTGEIVLGSQQPNFFHSGDVQTVMVAAGQLAAAIEQAKLYNQTDESLRRRVEQLTSLTRISRELNSALDLNHMLQRVFEEILRTTEADCGTILLFDLFPTGNEAAPETKMNIVLQLGDPHGSDLHPLERVVLERNEAVLVQDFEQTIDIRREGRTPLPPALPAHPGVRSAMIVPIGYQERIAGLIHLHAHRPHRFDQTALDIAETLAIQAEIALSNAYRYQEQVRRGELLDRRVGTLSQILELTQAIQPNQTLEQALEKIARIIQQGTPFEAVLISVFEGESQSLQRLVGLGISEDDLAILRSHPQPWNSVQEVLQPQFRIGRSYFIPYEQMPITPAELHTVTVLPLENTPVKDSSTWHPEDMFLIPLWDSTGLPLGLVSLDAPRDGLRPDLTTIEAVEVFASQAAFVIENQRRMQVLEGQIAPLHSEQQAEEVEPIQQELLEGAVEPAIAIQHLNQRVLRMRAGMDIAETLSRQADQPGVLLALGWELITRMGMENALVAEQTHHGPHLLHAMGDIPPGINVDALVGQRNPLLQCLESGEQILVSMLDEEGAWSGSALLQALRAKSFVCVPLQLEDEPHLAVLATGKKEQAGFTAEDEQLFGLLSRQAAISLQNIKLIQETRKRLADVNLLLDFNRQLGSLDSTHALQTLLVNALNILPQAQAGMVALWDAGSGLLRPQTVIGYTNNSRAMQITFRAENSLPGRSFLAGEPVRLDEVDFAQHYDLAADDLMRYRDATGGRLPVSSMVIPIAAGPQASSLGVLVLDNYSTPVAFNAEDQAITTSLAQQAALNLENTRLFRAAEQRASQLEALTQAARAITSWLQPDTLVSSLLPQLASILKYDTGTLWLLDEGRAVVQAAWGFADSEERTGLATDVVDSQLLNQMIQTGQAICVADIRQDERFPSLHKPENLSWLGVPLVSGRRVTGVIALEKNEPAFYSVEDIQIASTFAGQAAVALENAKLFQDSLDRAFELDQRTQRLEMLNRLSTALSETLDSTHILETASIELYRAVRCSGLVALLFDSLGDPQVISEYPPQPAHTPYPLPQAPLFERLRLTLGVFYAEEAAKESDLLPLAEFLQARKVSSLLTLPMITGSDLHGIFLLYSDEPYHFSPEETGLGRTISNQAAIAVQNARLYAETHSLSQDLERRVMARTTDLAREHQRAEILLRIITELSASLDLEQVLNRTLNVLNEVMDAEQISVLILREGETQLYHLASAGYMPVPLKENRTTPFSPDQGLAGWVISHQQSVLIPNVLEDDRWVQRPGTPSEHRSAVGVPLAIGEQVLGALLFFHRQPGHFSPDKLDLVQAAANQVAVAVNNAELYRLIRDQAEDLGRMLRDQQIETSRTRAILEAVADGVLVTDAERKITLFNASAEYILNLDRAQVIGKSLESFTGFFGGAARHWMETIHTWSQDPGTYQVGDVYEEQIELEDGRVVSVHLAPASLRNQFMGTVSVFRDITHEVEVDRLKSEFVATVSHELRTPMTSIRGYVDLLLMGAGGDLTDQQSRFLETVRNNTDRLTVLVNDLLDISRIETGKVTLSIQPLDLKDLAQQAVERLEERSQSERKPMQIKLITKGELPLAQGDPERVGQILDNLLENAFDYSAENGRITVTVHAAGDELQVDVRDSGIGIPAEFQPRVFERFYRGEHPYVLATAGTGLGLSIVQRLVEMHGGSIWVESSGMPGKGSTFSFTLRAHIPAAQREQVELSADS